LESRQRMAQDFGGLRLYPVLARRCSREDRPNKDLKRQRTQYEKAMPGAVVLCRNRPDLITFGNWTSLLEKPSFAPLYPGIPLNSAWFSPSVPFGTAFEHQYRLFGPAPTPKASLAEYEALIRIAPRDVSLVWSYMTTKHGPHPPFEPLRDAWGACADFDVACIHQLAESSKSDPAQFVRLERRLCDMSADFCSALGVYLAVHNRDAEGADVLRKWAAGARDRVSVANGVEWLVVYDYEHGRRSEAFGLAQMAADTYSARGLETLGKLLERDGDLKGAEARFQMERERYDDVSSLAAFYYRRVQAGDKGRASELEAALKKIFPSGLERQSGLSAAPVDGAQIKGVSETLEAAGLQKDDVLVAVNGIRVHNRQQYRVVLDFDFEPGMTVTVWRKGKSLEARVSPKFFAHSALTDYRR